MKLLFLTIALAVTVCAEDTSLSASSLTPSKRLQRRAVPPDGFCGVFEDQTIKCAATDCCSQFNFCGTTTAHCGTGCQTAFGGKCDTVSTSTDASTPTDGSTPTDASTPTDGSTPTDASTPPDGFCGLFNDQTIKCAATDCCSQFNFCGTTTAHCGTGCQLAFGGKCDPVKVLPPRTVPLPANAKQAIAHEKCTSPGMLAVTLDDGHSLAFNQKFLDELKANKIMATFFINGINGNWDISKHPEIVKRTFDAGHQIAHHTNTHADLALLDDAGIVSELCNLDMGIANALGGLIPRYIRFPFLSYSPQALKIAEFYGYIVVDVNLDTKDFEAGETKAKLDLALQQYSTLTKKSTKKDSFISLQHEIQEFTVDTLFPKLLPELRTTFADKSKKQYKLVTVGQCLDKGSKRKDWYRKNIWHRDPEKDPVFFCPSI